MTDIVSRSKNGRDATRHAVQELLKMGYLKKEYQRENGKLVGSNYVVSDYPQQ